MSARAQFYITYPRLLNIEQRLCHQPKNVKPKNVQKWAEFDHMWTVFGGKFEFDHIWTAQFQFDHIWTAQFPSKNCPNMVKLSLFLQIFGFTFLGRWHNLFSILSNLAPLPFLVLKCLPPSPRLSLHASKWRNLMKK